MWRKLIFRVKSWLLRLIAGRKIMVCMNMTVSIPSGNSGLKQTGDIVVSRCNFIGRGNEYILEGL
jgi:hypothetical protein